MKKLLITLALVASLALTSCSNTTFDDSQLWKSIGELELRVKNLEELCKQLNTNISALQTLVDALQSNDFVTSVTPIMEEGVEVGYTITFSKSQPITIYHGKDGEDGYTPQIGVAKDDDNIYYWTIDGEWLLDANGNKIKAVGSDGKNGSIGQDGADGITPKLKIQNGYWYVSYNNGSSWTQLGKATGEDGKNGSNGKDGDSFFQSVDTTNEDYVIFILANGTQIQLPRYKALEISFEKGDEIAVMAGSTFKVNYTLVGGSADTNIATITKNNWTAKVTKSSNNAGFLTISAPNPLTDDAIVVLVSEGTQTIMRSLTFVDGITTIATKAYAITSEATTLSVNVSTNLDYTVNIPSTASSWISLQGITSRAAVRNDVINLNINENTATSSRTATIQLVCNDAEVGTISIYQQGIEVANNELVYTSSDGNIIEPYQTMGFNANIVSNTYSNGRGVIVFDKDITAISEYAFYNCTKLTSIKMPKSITKIREYAFYDSGLTNLEMSNNVTEIATYAFYSTNLVNLVIPDSVISIGASAFYYCNSLTSITIPDSVTSIESYAFYGCTSLTSVTIPDSVTSIGEYAFYNCTSLTNVTIGNSVTTIENGAFYRCNSLTNIYCKPTTPPAIFYRGGGSGVVISFTQNSNMNIYVPRHSYNLYTQYSDYDGSSINQDNWYGYKSYIKPYDFE